MGDKIVVLAGASGNLGGLIAAELLAKPGVSLRALARPGSAGKLEALAARGAVVIEAPLEDATPALARALDGAFSVVSAVQGGPDVMIGAQSALLAAAARAGRALADPNR